MALTRAQLQNRLKKIDDIICFAMIAQIGNTHNFEFLTLSLKREDVIQILKYTRETTS